MKYAFGFNALQLILYHFSFKAISTGTSRGRFWVLGIAICFLGDKKKGFPMETT